MDETSRAYGDTGEPGSAEPGRVLETGRTVWRKERADRLTVIVDAADYFSAVRDAILKARHTVYLIGWDFDTRVTLVKGERTGPPRRLGKFLDWVARRRPGLRINLLKWDMGVLFALGRGSTPIFILDFLTHRNVSLKLDGAHPAAAAHHQKIVVIDDVLAFCGGIDITADRWDTREHRDDDPRRRRPTTRRRYGPWHDATTAVAGPAAAALGDMARERWRRATGDELPRPPADADPIWPDGLLVGFEGVEVGVARTLPALDAHKEVREIEALYLAAIASARRTLYIESQYFASRAVAEAIGKRLAEPDGPEIVVVNPETADGWLEEAVMGSARALLLGLLADVDRERRFRLYTPVTAGGAPIYVHAKILIADDRLLRVGSSNLNNRSMGYDTECDLALEAAPGAGDDDPVRRSIRALRDDLVAEHLGVEPSAIAAALADGGSLIGTIETLRGEGRTLRPFEPPEIGDLAEAVAARAWLDPEGVRRRRRLTALHIPRWPRRHRTNPSR